MQRKRRGGSVSLSVTLSLLSAIGIILGKYLAFNLTEFMRFSLENTTVIFTGIVFGPFYGAALGALQDIVGCIAVGYTINPIITLGSAAVGLVSGLIYRVTKRLSAPVSITFTVFAAHAVGSVIIKSFGLAVFYALPYGVTVLWRILNYAIVGAVEVFVLYILLKSKPLLAQINKITPFKLGGFKSASDASTYAKEVSGVFSKPGLERVTELLGALGNPEKEVKVVHVSGTNGKGSLSAMLASILKHSSLKVGTFNSPYLYEMRETIRIDGEPITEGELVSLFDRLRTVADKMADKPTEFELLSAAAYLAFREAKVDLAIVECGMGGGKDATNVIDAPLLSVITGISIDHTAFLGDTVEKIAKEKSGIVKKGCPILVGKCPEAALGVILDTARAIGAPATVCDTPAEAKSLTLDGSLIDTDGVTDIRLPLLGAHQLYNAALAVKAAHLLSEHFPTVTDGSIRDGIAAAKWSGRFEILSRLPLVIFDGAHNLDGIKSARASVEGYFNKKIVILTGVLADKEYEAMADELAKIASHAVTVTPENPRALGAKEYAEVLGARGINAQPTDSVETGVRTALALAKEEDAPLVCLGSLYLYREVSEAVKACLNTAF